MNTELRFGVLGPLTVSSGDGSRVALRGNRLPALLTELLFHANRTVPVNRLIEVLWGDAPPKSYVSNLHTYVSRLRDRLDGIPIELVSGGYRIKVRENDLDLLVFRSEVEAGRRAGDPATAAKHLRRALDQWRSGDLGVMDQPHLELEAVRLEAERIAVVEEWLDAELAAGRSTELLGELAALTRQYPMRERFAAQYMQALANAGRRAEALEVYRRTRATLVTELGIEPGRRLRDLHERVLSGH
ncbi:MAG: AfsR/SARP family transcriptional regulator [Kibdelosporangium sp.]